MNIINNRRKYPMYAFNRLTGLLSIAVLALLILGIATATTAQAGGDKIKTKFAMTELNKDAVPFPPDSPDAPGVRRGAMGTGKFEFDVNKNTFKLKVKAEGLQPNHDYVVQVTVTEGLGGPNAFAWFPQGVTTTNKKGKLNFEIANSPLVLNAIHPGDEQIDEWRMDFEIFDLADPLINGHSSYNLVCRPGTKVKLDESGKLILHTD